MTLAADVAHALCFVDGHLDTMSDRSLVPTSEVVDLLLDLRSLLVYDPIGTSHV